MTKNPGRGQGHSAAPGVNDEKPGTRSQLLVAQLHEIT